MTTADGQTPYRKQLEQALKHTRRVLRYSKRAKKALESVRRRDIVPANVDRFLDARASVQQILGKSGSTELESELTDWVDAIDDEVTRSYDERRRELIANLQTQAEERGAAFRRLGDTPPSVAIGPFQVVLEPGEDAAIKLGLEPVARAAADTDAIFEKLQKIRDTWDRRTPPSDELFDRIHRAYLMTCSREGRKPGDRVDLVDLLGPLALLDCNQGRLRKKGLASLTEYPRHLLARQLSVLSRERLLQHDGLRLELGAATGGSTRDKRDVMYVQNTPSQGQYFLTIRFTQQ